MCIPKPTISLAFFIVFGLVTSLSSSGHADDRTQEEKDFSRDHLRATAYQQSGDLESLKNLAAEIEREWLPRNKQMYGALMVHVLASWSTACGTFNQETHEELIRQYAERALLTYDSATTDNISIESQFELVSDLHERLIYTKGSLSDEEWASSRRQGAERFLLAWQRLVSAIDEKWNPQDRPGDTVTAPASVSSINGVPVEPNKDPVLRAQYESAVQRNREKIRKYKEQTKLRNLKEPSSRTVERYLSETYSIAPHAQDELQNMRNNYVRDPETKAKFLNAVEAKTSQKSE